MENEPKTIEYWLNTLPKKATIKALKNYRAYWEKEIANRGEITTKEFPSLQRALLSAFAWSKTKEGHDYWKQFTDF